MRVVLQARTSSQRLPGKALLPVRGVPLVVLAARRAARTGLGVVVATSTDASDDELTRTLQAAGVQVSRGALSDPLGRVTAACTDLANEARVIRLTGDNAVPDGDLLDAMLEQARLSRAEYLSVEWPSADLPYGVSAEIFSAQALRDAERNAREPADREHVTPYIRRTLGVREFRPTGLPAGAGARCTVDTFDDYVQLCRLFQLVDDPVAAPWDQLCALLAAHNPYAGRPIPRRPTPEGERSELVLGTAQLGLRYGIANVDGQPDAQNARELVRSAVAAGVTSIDTARAYGDSERRLGDALAGGLQSRVTVVTKLSALQDLPPRAPSEAVRSAVDASVYRSCHELRARRLDVVLLHRVAHLSSWKGVAWQRLLELRDEAVIGRLGASAGTVAEVRRALAEPAVTHLQLPVNVLDHRWARADVPGLLAARPDVVVHARSALLQGLLALEDASRWPVLPPARAEAVVRALRELAVEHGRSGVVDLCLAYVRGLPWVDGLVLGMDRQAHVDDAVELFRRPPLSRQEVDAVDRRLPSVPQALLDPSRWKRR